VSGVSRLQKQSVDGDLRGRMCAAALELGLKFTAEGIQAADIFQGAGGLEIVAPEEAEFTMKQSDVNRVLAAIGVIGVPANIRFSKTVQGGPSSKAESKWRSWQPKRSVCAIVETITPEMAKDIWECRNKHNRQAMDSVVAKYARDMKEGRWKLSGQPIIFDRASRLLDGHHRIKACMLAQVPFETLVVRGAEPEAVTVQDIGVPRTAAHVAHMIGVASAKDACAIARLVLIHRRGGIQKLNNPDLHPTKTEVVEFACACVALDKSGKVGRRAFKVMPPAPAGFLQVDTAGADRFFELLISGIALSKDSPIWLLRERLQAEKLKKSKLQAVYLYALSIKAWNAFIAGKKVGVLRWTTEELFPAISGK
jgi:hypothetical protein